ncbi:MAG: SDR family oxidoreductase [Microcoleus sp. PH2017_29_MFU_D_A]|jgi:NAD(P)-dependent dehydrogenase (short-subunit alcohol dehydrogenase family)|uniref:SDR family oxidoreductase n=1 Tax=unclassified Microcoleus TaxID=2642155 RepID=UPI001E0DDCFE|nr:MULTISPECIES: SDR family NAD(P)-dependent oxidoreductase [unclassified Microcoleus]MCC3421795.1 SDR family oxidoreductase [Microcoleus sp. PH2017_07_MST_O_A]MCC3432000.1 SDR family oxidoreductase [Microcoleus sp. PH2017_04_SCI_O_A]MCC3444444.1 SDR family oxidoreductase [Microcoleus sp. PH2017_03_ELD_O_A]MCC3469447.1 SDR family oxidoreductase [Microcoleus sp. PH2017_06_SFM_O_A]MCC3507238.1 SDR family oxidoreductase [Microcoleus sp. PH2017_19_SFW_U_A]TAE05592.1 MAG: SDR family oxidoreductase
MKLAEKVAVITGGGSGIGRAAGILIAQEGAKVAIIDRILETAQETVRELVNQGGCGLAIAADVADSKHMQQAFETIFDEYQRIDIVFANAGINGVWSPIEEIEPDEWDRTININLTGTFLTVKYAVPYLKKQGGSIVITSSINGTRSFRKVGATAYACSKAAQVAFAKMLALELAPSHIRVNVICPGGVLTAIDQSTVKRHLDRILVPADCIKDVIPLTDNTAGSSEEIAQLVLFLVSDASSFITGTEVWIDGGGSLI